MKWAGYDKLNTKISFPNYLTCYHKADLRMSNEKKKAIYKKDFISEKVYWMQMRHRRTSGSGDSDKELGNTQVFYN